MFVWAENGAGMDNDMIDKDTRLFFDSHNCVTMGDIRPLLTYFDIKNNDENVRQNSINRCQKTKHRQYNKNNGRRYGQN